MALVSSILSDVVVPEVDEFFKGCSPTSLVVLLKVQESPDIRVRSSPDAPCESIGPSAADVANAAKGKGFMVEETIVESLVTPWEMALDVEDRRRCDREENPPEESPLPPS